jgi:hypothetical protein
MLANAERVEAAVEEAFYDLPDGGLIDITGGTVGGHPLPPAWWDMPEVVGPLKVQLQRCIDALGEAGVERTPQP